jgi:hypothetical protein
MLGILGSFGCEGTTEPDLGFGTERVFSTHKEVDVRFRSSGMTLAGTLLLPLTPGLHPAIVVVLGSDCWTRARSGLKDFARNWLDHDIAVLVYDKRGAGESSGVCPTPATLDERRQFPLFADDALAALRTLHERAEVDPARIGL